MADVVIAVHYVVLQLLKLLGVVIVVIFLRVLVWFFNLLVLRPVLDPLKRLPGPDGKFFQTHFNEVTNPNISPDTHDSWIQKYGHTFRFHGFGKHDYRVLSLDLRAISHILNSPIYEKPWQTRDSLSRLLGKGLFSMEGQEHSAQRKIVNPAFSNRSVRQTTPVMFQKAEELCNRWIGIISNAAAPEVSTVRPENQKSGAPTIDVSHWISRASFDVIGLTGFSYQFHALEEESEPVYMAYRRMFRTVDRGTTFRNLADLYLPFLRKLWPGEDNMIIDNSLAIINEAGQDLIANKNMEIMDENLYAQGKNDKDLLSLLIKSNMSTDHSRRLTDQVLIDQCSTFLFAGTDSVSTAISWCLHLLSLAPIIQEHLREELICSSGASADAPNSAYSDKFRSPASPVTPLRKTMRRTSNIHSPEDDWDFLDSLPYLDAVVRETLRLCPPVHATIRVAMEDDQIPISHPIHLPDGTTLHGGGSFAIRKGSYIHIPIEGLNYCHDLWGPDAREFKSERWFNLPPEVRSHPGLGNSMTFGFGPHSCLGYKFTIAEMKIFLATLITNFIFEPAPEVKIYKHNAMLTRPYLKGKWGLGPQLPLIVRRIHQEDEVYLA